MTNLLRDLTISREQNIHSITSRVKKEKDLREKVKKGGGKYRVLTDVHDVLGLRVITYFSEDVRKVGDIIEQSIDFKSWLEALCIYLIYRD